MNTAKEWLSRAWRVSQEVDALQRAKAEALARVSSSGGSDSTPVSGTRDPHAKLEAYVAYSARLDHRIEDLLTVQGEISDLIRQVRDVRYRELLTRRYLNCERWESIAAEMGYELRSVYRLHGSALQVVQQLLPDDVIVCH